MTSQVKKYGRVVHKKKEKKEEKERSGSSQRNSKENLYKPSKEKESVQRGSVILA